jgi:SRSO17 transposase
VEAPSPIGILLVERPCLVHERARCRQHSVVLRQRLHHIIARDHACAYSIGLIDETSDTKKGVKTPGVQRQHCGAVGKQDNCIVTVHLGYAADEFHTLLDGELFLPESWSNDRPRCREAGIPDTMVYRPKTEIALELLRPRRRQRGPLRVADV